MNCPVCGTDNREGARFCRRCGKALAEPPLSEEPEEAAFVETPEAPVPTAEASGVPPEEPPAKARAIEEPGEEPAPEPDSSEGTETKAEAGTPAEPGEGEETEEAPPRPEGEVLAFWREEAKPLAAVMPGTVIAGRYVVAEVLDAQEDEILYLGHDLQRCWQCGFEGNAPDDAFCAQCGAALDRKAGVRLVEVRDAEAEPRSGEQVVARLAHEGRTLLLLAGSKAEVEAPAMPWSVCLFVGQRSDPGHVRELNEDSLLTLTLAPTCESRTAPLLGLFAVADGMGGHEGGEVASKMALQVLSDQVLRTLVLPELAGEVVPEEDISLRLRQATIAANDAVYLARQKAGNDMGTTLTIAFVRDDRLFLAHVGDCRAYRWNADGLEQLTTDHSVVASMIASGQATPEEIYTHPQRSIIYRCIGDKPAVEVDTGVLPLTPGDRLVLCSDGLWEMVRNEGIEDVMMQEADPQAACDLLVKHANAAGGEDNISVVVIQVEIV